MAESHKSISEDIKEKIKSLKSPNIAVIGRTGVGKSTLINSVFGVNIAEVGAGLPVTKGFCRFPPEDLVEAASPVVIYDSPGYEATKETEWVQEILSFLEDKSQEGPEERIHLIWYVMNAASARVELFEKDILDKINGQNIPAVIVLSQCDRSSSTEKDKIEQAIEEFGLTKVYSVIRAGVSPLEIDGKPICSPFGAQELVDKTVDLLPEIYTDAVISMQIADLKAKRKVAWNYILTAASATFVSGVSPIPVTTPAVSLASQSALCIAIASVYGYQEFVKLLQSASIATVSALNSFLLTSLLDLLGTFFPPTKLLEVTVAASYITGLGLTYASVFENLARAKLKREDMDDVEQFLKDNFRQEFKKYASINVRNTKALKLVGESFVNG